MTDKKVLAKPAKRVYTGAQKFVVVGGVVYTAEEAKTVDKR